MSKRSINTNTRNSQFEFWAQRAKALAALMVVAIHVSVPVLYKGLGEGNAAAWHWANIVDSISRISVPTFFMLSGYFLLGKKEDIATFAKKRLHKVIIPFVAWSIIYILWNAYYEGRPIGLESFTSLLNKPANFHLWFFYALLGIYVLTPILRVFAQNTSKTIYNYALAIWFILSFLYFLRDTGSLIELDIFFGFLGYVLLGGYIAKYNPRFSNSVLWIVLLASYATTILATYLITISNDESINTTFYGYVSPNVLIGSFAAFLLAKKFLNFSTTASNNKFVSLQKAGAASLGIYLIHPIVIDLLNSDKLAMLSETRQANEGLMLVPFALAVFILSYILTMVLMGIPVLRRIVP